MKKISMMVMAISFLVLTSCQQSVDTVGQMYDTVIKIINKTESPMVGSPVTLMVSVSETARTAITANDITYSISPDTAFKVAADGTTVTFTPEKAGDYNFSTTKNSKTESLVIKVAEKPADPVVIPTTTSTTTPETPTTTTTTETPTTPTTPQIVYFTITFNSNGGSEVTSQTVESGKLATKPTDPTKADYYFNGWDYDFTKAITSNITVNAKWTQDPVYTVTFNSNDGSEVTSQYIKENGKVTQPSNPSKTGYTFSGWDYDFAKTITSNITVNAQWTINKYTVTFMIDGSQVSTQVVDYGNNAYVPSEGTKIGYTFSGWDKSNTNITSNLTITSTWNEVNNPELVGTWNDSSVSTTTYTFNQDGTGSKTATKPVTVNATFNWTSNNGTITISNSTKTGLFSNTLHTYKIEANGTLTVN